VARVVNEIHSFTCTLTCLVANEINHAFAFPAEACPHLKRRLYMLHVFIDKVAKLTSQTLSLDDADDCLLNGTSWSGAEVAFRVHLVRHARYDSGPSLSNDCIATTTLYLRCEVSYSPARKVAHIGFRTRSAVRISFWWSQLYGDRACAAIAVMSSAFSAHCMMSVRSSRLQQ